MFDRWADPVDHHILLVKSSMDWAIFKDESDLGKCPSGCVKFPPPHGTSRVCQSAVAWRTLVPGDEQPYRPH